MNTVVLAMALAAPPGGIDTGPDWLALQQVRYAMTPAMSRPYGETEWVRFLAAGWDCEVEHRLFDNTRVDVLTRRYAVEVDWAEGLKWAEAVGQALYYAAAADREPMVILLRRAGTEAEEDRVHRCLIAAGRAGVRVVVIDLRSVTGD